MGRAYKFGKLPQIDTLKIFDAICENHNLKCFLTLIDRFKIKRFVFDGNIKDRLNKVDVINFYLQSLDSAFRSKVVKLSNWYFSHSSVESLLDSWQGTENLVFEWWEFGIDSDLSVINNKFIMKTLTFTNCYQDNSKSLAANFIEDITNKIRIPESYGQLEHVYVEYSTNSEYKDKKSCKKDCFKNTEIKGFSIVSTNIINKISSSLR